MFKIGRLVMNRNQPPLSRSTTIIKGKSVVRDRNKDYGNNKKHCHNKRAEWHSIFSDLTIHFLALNPADL